MLKCQIRKFVEPPSFTRNWAPLSLKLETGCTRIIPPSECCLGISVLKISVTRFGEISPLWQHFKSLWRLFEGLFSLGQNFETSWEKIFVIEIIFMVVNGWKLTNNVAIRTHCSSSSMHACVRVHSMKSLQQKKWFKSFSRSQLLLLQKLYELFIQNVLP